MHPSEPPDFRGLDDPAFLAARTRVRHQLEQDSMGTEYDDLARLYEAMNEEFCQRARIAWTQARQPRETGS
jgi:hypothetical protein